MGRISLPQGKGNRMHNLREYKKYGRDIPQNIDQEKTKDNIVIFDRDIKEVYKEIFGEAVREYNAKQKRNDRKIEDYYYKICKSKNGEKIFYEDILQWGSKEDFKDPENVEKAKEALEFYARDFQKRNPNLIVIGAYIHMDEASPHLHLDYIPIAHGYKTGLKTRNSLDRAMKEMGYGPEKESKQNNATKMWKEHERAYFGEICRELGLEVEEERKARGSLSVEEYKEAKDKMMGELVEEKANIEKDLEVKKDTLQKMDEVTKLIKDDKIPANDVELPGKKNIFGKEVEPATKGVFIEGMNKDQVQTIMQRAKVNEGIEHTFETTQAECKEMLDKAQREAEKIKAEATAEKNEEIRKAQEIISQKENIIRMAQEFAEGIQKKLKETADKLKALLRQKDNLEKEIAEKEAYKAQLDPLIQKVDDLNRAKDTLEGNVASGLIKRHFKDWDEMPFGESWEEYRARGELLAVYNDGTVRQVGLNKNGGWDDKTWKDKEKGLCKVGILQEETQVKIPQRLLNELLKDRNRSIPLSPDLNRFIQNEDHIKNVIRDYGDELDRY